jgi:hypothetical protein
MWQHVFQAVVCVLNTATLLTIYFYSLILQKSKFSKAQRKLPEDGPDGPKHVGGNIEIF